MAKPYKITFFSGLGQGGAAKQIVETAHLLAAKGHQVQIITYDQGKAFYPVQSDIEIADISGQGHFARLPFLDRLWSVVRLTRTLRQSRPDVVISYTTLLNLILGIVGLLFLRRRDMIFIGSERNSKLRYHESKVWALLCRLFYKGLDGVFSNSPVACSSLQTILHLPAGRVAYLPNLLNVDYFCPPDSEARPAGRPWTVLVPARVTPQKNQKILVPVAEYIKKNGRYCRFVLAGYQDQPYTAELQEMIRQENLTDCFEIIGSQADIRSCYRQADLIFLPSLYEGLSNSLIEALACECLVLCSDIPEFSCLIQDQENGFLVPLDEPERIGQKIIKIMQYDEDQLAPIRHQARLSVLPFGPDGYYANLSAMIQQFARSGLARSARSPEKV